MAAAAELSWKIFGVSFFNSCSCGRSTQQVHTESVNEEEIETRRSQDLIQYTSDIVVWWCIVGILQCKGNIFSLCFLEQSGGQTQGHCRTVQSQLQEDEDNQVSVERKPFDSTEKNSSSSANLRPCDQNHISELL